MTMHATMTQTRHETQLRLRVLKKIMQHTKDNPVKYDVLALEFNVEWREIASCVEDLRDAGWKIGTTNGNPSGCFLAKTPEDLQPTIDRLSDQAKRILVRVSKMKNWNDQQPKIFDDARFGIADENTMHSPPQTKIDRKAQEMVERIEIVLVHCPCGYISRPWRSLLEKFWERPITCNGDVDKPCGRRFKASKILELEKNGEVFLKDEDKVSP